MWVHWGRLFNVCCYDLMIKVISPLLLLIYIPGYIYHFKLTVPYQAYQAYQAYQGYQGLPGLPGQVHLTPSSFFLIQAVIKSKYLHRSYFGESIHKRLRSPFIRTIKQSYFLLLQVVWCHFDHLLHSPVSSYFFS